MTRLLSLILPAVLLAAGAGLLGGITAFFWSPKIRARSAIQHFAAGAVLAAVASNVIPEVERIGTVTGVLGGLAAGGLAMIGLKWLVLRFERKGGSQHALPAGLAAAAATDTLLDGAIISAGFMTGERVGTLLTVALAIELFFLTLSVDAEFRRGKFKRWHGLVITSAIASLLLVGATSAAFFLRGASEVTVAIVLAFGPRR